MYKRKRSRFIPLILVFALCLSIFGVLIFADHDTEGGTLMEPIAEDGDFDALLELDPGPEQEPDPDPEEGQEEGSEIDPDSDEDEDLDPELNPDYDPNADPDFDPNSDNNESLADAANAQLPEMFGSPAAIQAFAAGVTYRDAAGNRVIYDEVSSVGGDYTRLYPTVASSGGNVITIQYGNGVNIASQTDINSTSPVTSVLLEDNTVKVTLDSSSTASYDASTIILTVNATVGGSPVSYEYAFWPSAGFKFNVGSGATVTIDEKNGRGANGAGDPGPVQVSNGAYGVCEREFEIEIIATVTGSYRIDEFTITPTTGNLFEKNDNTYTINANNGTIPADIYTVTVKTSSTNTGGNTSTSTSGNGNGGSNLRESTTSTFGAPSTAVATTPLTDSVVSAAAATALGEATSAGTGTAVVKFTGDVSISASLLASITQQAQAAGLAAVVQADNIVGTAVEVRMSFNPAAVSGDIGLGGSTTNAEAKRINTLFGTFFTNKLAAVNLNHTGSYGTPVRFAVQADLTGITMDNIVLYSYDKASNSYQRIREPDCRIDDNGYLWFTTTQGGAVIVSNGPLTKAAG